MSLLIFLFSEISDLSCLLNEMQSSSNIFVKHMGMNIKQNFDKYWGYLEKMNSVIFITTILDPRYKIEFIEFSIFQMYGEELGSKLFTNLKSDLSLLFDDYMSLYESSSTFDSCGSQSSQPNPQSEIQLHGKTISLIKERFKKHKQNFRI